MRADNKNKIHPQVFALYLAMASITMMFIALTSAYIVRQGAGNWLLFKLPNWFLYSTVAIILSSVTLYFSHKSYVQQQNKTVYQLGLLATLILGFVFIGLQYSGWTQMTSWGIELTGNPSGSFVYVLSGLHAAHVLGGIAALIIALIHSVTLPFEFKDYRKRRFDLTSQYWHFVGVLWVYLLIFLIIQQ